MWKVDYSGVEVPEAYVCCVCGATGCKLWRKHGGALDFWCCQCASTDPEGGDISTIDGDGRMKLGNTRTDQIGGRFVPAVPAPYPEGGMCCHGYGNVPQEAVDWWRRLFTFPD